MGLPIHVAIVPDGVEINPGELTRTAAAISKQVVRDFSPLWNVEATVDAFMNLDDVPPDYLKITIVGGASGNHGFHKTEDHQPYAVVSYDPLDQKEPWSHIASHECLEMLADPCGCRLRDGPMPEQALGVGESEARVSYLVEVCDPCESVEFAYTVNDVVVSDFYTPEFFDPDFSPGVRYSFTGKILKPRQVLPGGYITWKIPDAIPKWFQLRMFKDGISSVVPHVVNLTDQEGFTAALNALSPRVAVDRYTGGQLTTSLPKRTRMKARISREARLSNAVAFRQQLELLQELPPVPKLRRKKEK